MQGGTGHYYGYVLEGGNSQTYSKTLMKKMRKSKCDADDLHKFCSSSVFIYSFFFLNLYFVNKVNKAFTVPV